MPTLPSASTGPMSALSWREACARVAGSVSGARQPDSVGAARDALNETLQDWDTRHDWRFEQIIADNIAIDSAADSYTLPTTFKKPYVAYLVGAKVPLWYIERGNWHRAFPGEVSRQIPRYYTLYNTDATGNVDLFPLVGIADTLVVLYYRSMIYTANDDAVVDIPARWETYILDGAKGRLSLGKGAHQKADRYMAMYEAGIHKAKVDDRRLPDQFLSFEPPSQIAPPYWLNPNSTWESVVGD